MGRSETLLPSHSRKNAPTRAPGTEHDRGRGVSRGTTGRFLFQQLATLAAIFASLVVVYWPALTGGIIWDDERHITRPALQSLHGLWRIWFDLTATQQYYPLLHSAFWVEHRLWGDAVIGYHLANLTEHALSAFLIILILRRLEFRGAWLAGLLWALHPVCVESVAWMSEQKSTLSGVFYFAAALAYLHFDRSRRKSQYFAALALFVLALLSKSVTATLPAALLVVFWWQRGRIDWRRDVMPLLPWFIIGATAGLFTAWVEAHVIGASGAGYALTPIQHLLLTGRMLCFYAGKILWPSNLMFSYPLWQIDPKVWWQYLYPLAVGVLLAGLVMLARLPGRRVQRGPLAGFLYFGGTLFPVLGFLHVFPFKYSYVADHFQYLAMLGIIVPVAWLLSLSVPRIPKMANAAVAVLVLAVLGFLTWQQAGLYRDAETLYRATLVRNPQSWMTHNNLGIYLVEKEGRLNDAMAEFQAVLRIRPDHAKAHMNLGNILAQMPGRTADAIAEYHASLQLDPNYVPAYLDLGMALMQTPGGLPDAIATFQTALQLEPNDAPAHQLMGMALEQTPGRLPDAIKEYEAALAIRPGDPYTRMKLADTLAKIPDRRQEAIGQYEKVMQLRPGSPEAGQASERLRALETQSNEPSR